ncbi:uncharacterized protein Cipc isoform X2 [Anabrus simplex]|uniref:uncharacterized protein Cipc isoform X2 n=1 Tax=Anabrus simplex TaxID=316456 RepID=UPI0035A2E1AF
MSPSFMPSAAQEGVGLNTMRPRRRITRAMTRQIVRRRDQQRRGRVWLQSGLNLMGDVSPEDQPDILSDSISSSPDSDSSSSSRCSSDRKSPSPRHINPGFDDSLSTNASKNSCFGELLGSGKAVNQRLLLLQRRDGLLNITIRTMKLMRRNQQLQQRLAQLQAETRAFVRSVMNNPENQGLRITSETMMLVKQQDNKKCEEPTDTETENQDKESIGSESGDSGVEK